VRVVVLFGPPDLPRIEHIGIDGAVVWFASAVGVITGITFGVAPALQVSRRGATEVVGRQDRNSTMPFASARGRSMLLLTEIALTLMLLAGAGLMLRSLVRVQDLDLGFDPTDVLTAQMLLSATRYPIDPTQFRTLSAVPVTLPDSRPAALLMQLEERLRAVPGVQSVGAVSALPLDPGGADYDLPVLVEGRPRPRLGEEPQADFRIVTPGYFETLGIPLTQGREFSALDGPNGPSVAIINETMARELFPGEDPLGKKLILYGRPREIIGVVGSVRHRGFIGAARPEMVLPSRQFQLGSMTMVIRSRLDAAELKAAFARTVHSLDPSQPVFRMRMMDEYLQDSMAQPRFTTLVLGGFAGLAVVLSLVGVYGVISYSVAQRTREFGVRLALGANPLDIIGMVLRRGMAIAMTGIAVGLIGAAVGTRVMAGLLFGVTATDPPAFAAAAAGLVVASLLAMCIPAVRAARIAPVISLKSD
jgi:putative ABC transport system permease protein